MADEQKHVNEFRKLAKEWLCDNYYVSISYIARKKDDLLNIVEALISFSPIPPQENSALHLDLGEVVIGKDNIYQLKESESLRIISSAIRGKLTVNKKEMALSSIRNYNYHFASSERYRWFYDQKLKIMSDYNHELFKINLFEVDNLLRVSSPPFDGLADAANWIGLHDINQADPIESIDLIVLPPIDLMNNECRFRGGLLSIKIVALYGIDVQAVHLSLTAHPSANLSSRKIVDSKISWSEKEAKDGKYLEGNCSISLNDTDSVLVMLMAGKSIVRRQWFIDNEKSRNSRLHAVNTFDVDLKMTKRALFDDTDSNRFENGVSVLMFLLGFASCVQIETDSPDVIMQTPKGGLVLVECTLRISDFSTKLGKLIDRRNKLKEALQSSGLQNKITIILVCRQPKELFKSKTQELLANKALLFSEENLRDSIIKFNFFNDPDKIIEEAERELENAAIDATFKPKGTGD